MREIGKVVKTEKDFATIEIKRKDECSKCGVCGMKNNMPKIEFLASNEMKANEGDVVVVETKKDNKLIASVLVFLIPVILLAISLFLGYKLINDEIWILVLCLGTIVLWYTILAVIDKKLAKTSNFCPVIVEIKGENNE